MDELEKVLTDSLKEPLPREVIVQAAHNIRTAIEEDIADAIACGELPPDIEIEKIRISEDLIEIDFFNFDDTMQIYFDPPPLH